MGISPKRGHELMQSSANALQIFRVGCIPLLNEKDVVSTHQGEAAVP